MKKNIQSIIFIAFAINFASCQKKTQPQTTTPPQEANASRRGNGEREGNRPPNGERPQFADLLDRMDTNKDGKLAKSEVKGPLEERFAEVDTNKDGFISEAEFKNAPRPQGPPNKN